MPPIKHFAPPPGVKSPPLSFAARTGDLLFVSGIPGFDENGRRAASVEAPFGFVVANLKGVRSEAGPTFAVPAQGPGRAARLAEGCGRARARCGSASGRRHRSGLSC